MCPDHSLRCRNAPSQVTVAREVRTIAETVCVFYAERGHGAATDKEHADVQLLLPQFMGVNVFLKHPCHFYLLISETEALKIKTECHFSHPHFEFMRIKPTRLKLEVSIRFMGIKI